MCVGVYVCVCLSVDYNSHGTVYDTAFEWYQSVSAASTLKLNRDFHDTTSFDWNFSSKSNPLHLSKWIGKSNPPHLSK